MLRISAIYVVVLAFEQGDTSMRPAWTVLILLIISIICNVILKMIADLHSVRAGYFIT